MSWCVKVDTLGRLCDNDLERSYDPFTITNIYFTRAAYNSYFYKPSTLIISPWTFSMQLGACTSLSCLSQCTIPFCTPSTDNINISLELFLPMVISYSTNIPADPNLWDGNFTATLFGTNKFLQSNICNMACLL